MIRPHAPFEGGRYFPQNPLIVREGAILTDTYVLCSAYREPHGGQDGDIDVGAAMGVTLWLWLEFGSLTSIEIKPVFLPAQVYTAVAGLTDLAALQADGWLIVTSATGGFTQAHVGSFLEITNVGTNFTLGWYRIVSVTDGNTIVVARAAGSTGDASSGQGSIVVPEFQQLTLDTSVGVSALVPHSLQLVAADVGDGVFMVTIPTPAAPLMRVYVKGTGTMTGSNIAIGVTKIPPMAL